MEELKVLKTYLIGYDVLDSKTNDYRKLEKEIESLGKIFWYGLDYTLIIKTYLDGEEIIALLNKYHDRILITEVEIKEKIIHLENTGVRTKLNRLNVMFD